VGQERISGEAVLGFVRRVAPLDLGAAFFELTLAMALEHFLNMHLEVATVEAGIGAKDDATAVLANVLCTVITNIGEDHLHLLGPGLLDVARDKAEAIRPGVPVVTGAEGDALGVIGEVASARFMSLAPTTRCFQLSPWRRRPTPSGGATSV
jgi:dihydrofolate synthase/folylpolyglutamate synthase